VSQTKRKYLMPAPLSKHVVHQLTTLQRRILLEELDSKMI